MRAWAESAPEAEGRGAAAQVEAVVDRGAESAVGRDREAEEMAPEEVEREAAESTVPFSFSTR